LLTAGTSMSTMAVHFLVFYLHLQNILSTFFV
jgi:hypothetical protein